MPLVANLFIVGLFLIGPPSHGGADEPANERDYSMLPHALQATSPLAGVNRWGPPALELSFPPVNLSLGSSDRSLQRRSSGPVGEGGKVKEGRWRRRLFAAAGLTVTAATVARWSKQKADRSYNRYLTAANRETQKRQFDRAERYDRISGVAFAAMEAGVFLTTYFVFF